MADLRSKAIELLQMSLEIGLTPQHYTAIKTSLAIPQTWPDDDLIQKLVNKGLFVDPTAVAALSHTLNFLDGCHDAALALRQYYYKWLHDPWRMPDLPSGYQNPLPASDQPP